MPTTTYLYKTTTISVIRYNNIIVNNIAVIITDHNPITTKHDGKTVAVQGPPVAKTAAPAPVPVSAPAPAAVAAVKAKATKKDVVDRETLQLVETQLRHVTKGFDAVSVLFKYLVNDVSAIIFSPLYTRRPRAYSPPAPLPPGPHR